MWADQLKQLTAVPSIYKEVHAPTSAQKLIFYLQQHTNGHDSSQIFHYPLNCIDWIFGQDAKVLASLMIRSFSHISTGFIHYIITALWHFEFSTFQEGNTKHFIF
jgi:hypothetical protein